MLGNFFSAIKVKFFHLLLLLSLFFLVSIPFFSELKNRITSSEHLLDMYKSSLESEISRYKFLPFILSQNDKFLDILSGKMDSESAGYFLQRTKYATNVSTIYVLNENGETVASSNWYRQDSYIGQYFGFRPYFLDAMAGRLGQFYGIAISSLKPGFFIAYGIRSGEHVEGVVTIEINLSGLENVWGSGPDEILVYDVNDIVFLSSSPYWKHKIFGRPHPNSSELLKVLFNNQESERPLTASLSRCYSLGDLTLYEDNAFGCLFPSKISIEEKIIDFGWTITSLQSTRYVYLFIFLVFFISVLIYAILVFSYRNFKNKFTRSLEKLRNQLTENSKLAAIGQMATEVAHEFNQPLAAIYMLLDTTRLLMGKRRFKEADDNLVLISSHIERMTQQISQIKSFASRHRVPRGKADIVQVVNGSIRLFQLTLKQADVKLIFETSHTIIYVPCNEIGLEQIFSNLITNALDAMAEQEKKVLEIFIDKREDGDIVVRVHDNGGGLSDPSIIFQSFYSTKQRGTGLGLAIINGIVENSGGTISARNNPDGGAEFILKWRELKNAGTGEDNQLTEP